MWKAGTWQRRKRFRQPTLISPTHNQSYLQEGYERLLARVVKEHRKLQLMLRSLATEHQVTDGDAVTVHTSAFDLAMIATIAQPGSALHFLGVDA